LCHKLIKLVYHLGKVLAYYDWDDYKRWAIANPVETSLHGSDNYDKDPTTRELTLERVLIDHEWKYYKTLADIIGIDYTKVQAGEERCLRYEDNIRQRARKRELSPASRFVLDDLISDIPKWERELLVPVAHQDKRRKRDKISLTGPTGQTESTNNVGD
jgi:hypothetical protein